MILNLNKDFFLGALVWYIMLNAGFHAFQSVVEAERNHRYSFWDEAIVTIICAGWILA